MRGWGTEPYVSEGRGSRDNVSVNLVLFTLTGMVIGSLILDIDRLIGNLVCYVNSSIVNMSVQLAAFALSYTELQ